MGAAASEGAPLKVGDTPGRRSPSTPDDHTVDLPHTSERMALPELADQPTIRRTSASTSSPPALAGPRGRCAAAGTARLPGRRNVAVTPHRDTGVPAAAHPRAVRGEAV